MHKVKFIICTHLKYFQVPLSIIITVVIIAIIINLFQLGLKNSTKPKSATTNLHQRPEKNEKSLKKI